MNPSSMPISLLLQEERTQHTKLLQLSLREQRIVEQFTAALEAVATDRRDVQRSLSSIRTAIQGKKKLIALLQCPPELRQWQALHAPIVDRDEVELLMPSKDEPATIFANSAASTLPLSAQDRASIEATVASSSSPRLERAEVPSVLQDNAFVPFIHPTTKAFMKRPCGGDVTVMKSSAPHMGRVIVSLRSFHTGQLVFAESPSLSIPASDATLQLFLPPVLQQVYSRIADQQRVFDAKPSWDRRLLSPFLAYVQMLLEGRADPTNRRAAMLPLLLKALSNPLKDMTPDAVEDLCEYVQFLRAALPTHLDGIVSEDEACRFLATFQTNAAAFQSTAAHMCLLDTASQGSLATSVYATGPQARCLFGLVSMLEHSCQPNAALVWHRTSTLEENDAMVIEVRALRPIAVGEHLSISYIPTVLPREERQALLWKRYWFHCQCSRCVGAPDLLRGVTLPHTTERAGRDSSTTRIFAPVGSGSTWTVIGDSTYSAEVATSERPRSAVLFESEMKALSERDPVAVIDRCLQSSPSTLDLSVFHYIVLRNFVAVCGGALSQEGDAFSSTVDRIVRYSIAVSRATFADPNSISVAPLCELLNASPVDPVARWFSQAKDSTTTRRDRLTAPTFTESTHMQSDVVNLAAEVLTIRSSSLGDLGHVAVAFCVAVWELLFGVLQHAVPIAPSTTKHRLVRLRRGAALGLWLMQTFSLSQHEATRAMQWQAALLEAADL
ncbi:Hypothetical protein, putative [Bodo saltans]|uniref:SET domain-containing protein n=1 Tax=Bodo saltans TaxID=75058 RepID=A0A0S4JAS6_BODSA|nr:Hypothetical protein, putative [Bodo saltans]|eukprot:CUG86101.1 Hypothetical protein, putative [Bodo saltans]